MEEFTTTIRPRLIEAKTQEEAAAKIQEVEAAGGTIVKIVIAVLFKNP